MANEKDSKVALSSWEALKAGLLSVHGRGGVPYSPADKVMFLKSLTKGRVEGYHTFMLRSVAC